MLKSGILPSFGGSSTYICYMHAYDVWASPCIGSCHYVYENCIGTWLLQRYSVYAAPPKEGFLSASLADRLYDPFGSPHRGQKPFSKREGCNRPQCCFSKIIPSFFTIKEGFFESLRLPLAKGSSTFLTKPLFNSLYAPFGSPSSGGQKPSGTRGCNRPPVLRTATL